jgi:DUF883 C-terminal glycine zipper region
MLTTHPSTVVQKRDLHVGGLGPSASGAAAAFTDPALHAADSWLATAKAAARDADEFVTGNPWTAVAIVAAMGVAAGYLLSRRA